MSTSINIYDSFEQALKESGEYVTQVRGVSMYPMLRYRKDPVLIHPVTQEIKRYDIVVYAKEDRYVIHRVLQVWDDCYVIRGDNCIAKEYVPKQAVRGIVVGFWRFGKYIAVTDWCFRAYSKIWVAINPLVRAHHKLKAMAYSIGHRIKECLKKS